MQAATKNDRLVLRERHTDRSIRMRVYFWHTIARIDTMKIETKFVDIKGLRESGIFPECRVPSIRTLRDWTKRRLIPYIKVGQFIYFDPEEVLDHLQNNMKIRPRG